MTAPGASPGLFIIGPQRRVQTPTRKHHAPNGQEHGDQQPTPGANYTQETAGVQSFKPDDTRLPSATFPQNVSADRVLSLLMSPSLSCLLCGGCSGPLAHSVWNSSPSLAGSPHLPVQHRWPTACLPGQGAVTQALRHASQPPWCPLPTLPSQAISNYLWEAGPLSDNTHAHARTLQIAPTGYGCRLLPYLT